MFEGFERRTVEVDDGISIACVTAGSGPPVLLLHGFPQTRAMWAQIAPRLVEAGYSVVCADLRGYGESAKPQIAAGSVRTTVSARWPRIRSASCARSAMNGFIVVGHDRGGRTAHRMALDHPEAVRSLAVLDIVPTYAMFMETNRHLAGAYWHWYFLSAARAVAGADDRRRSGLLLRDLPRRLGLGETGRFRRGAARSLSTRLARPGHDPRLVLRLSRGGDDRPRS